MVKSMTGYGRARETRNKRDITVEVRSVNNRYLDCTVKLPRAYVFAEDAIKGRVQKAVSRGKVDVFVTIDSSAADVSVVKVNEPLARSYYEALLRLKETFGLSGEVTPVELSRCPDVLSVTKAEEDLETLAEDICQVTDAALAAYNRMRSVEGVKLAEDIAGRADTIEDTVARVEAQSPQTVSAYRERLESKMREVLASTTIDEARILTETAIFADKIAVDEETVRIFIAPPSWVELERRLTARGTDSQEVIQSRLLRAKVELQTASSYDYLVINDTVEQAVAEMAAILRAEHCRPAERLEQLLHK